LVQARMVATNTAYLTGRALARTAVQAFLTDDPDRMMHCSTAKLVCTEGYLEGARNMMMLMGHQGYETGPYASAFCDAAGSCIAAGTSDIQVVNIFNHLTRCHQRNTVV
jgi:isovaleryl-CoA dehydrogenase